MPRIPTLKARLPTLPRNRVPLPPKQVDEVYTTPEHRAWAKAVKERAGYRCEWVENGKRCEKAEPEHRVVADHIVEVKDGGPRYDLANGQCLCVQHNTMKGVRARAKRLGLR